MKSLDFENISWTRMDKTTKILAEKLKRTGIEFSSISTISRGGLVPSRLLADYLGIDKIFVDKKTIPKDSLFVDDIFDSGNTFKKIIAKVENPQDFLYATLFARKGKKFPKQLIYAQKTRGNEYIVYPWDKIEHKRMKKLGM